MNKTVLIIDGTNIMHRNHFAYPEALTDGKGNRTGAIFGTIKHLKKFADELKPIQMYICTDISRNTFRTDIYSEYKATRGETDPALKAQMPLLEEFCEYANIPYLKMQGFEADDLIGSLAKNTAKFGFNPVVISGDKDVFQLIDEDINVMYVSQKGLVKYDLEQLKEKYSGLTPEQFLELKALMGDKSDNIPGVPNVGEKTGIKLLKEFGSIDEIYNRIDELKGKQRERLIENRDIAYLSKKLATIVTDLDLDYNNYFEVLTEIDFSFNNNEVQEFFKRLNIEQIK
ncbi:5'-3' exonuclease [Alkaliphilus sp. B6464]|uniref:5'-3' exonuclease n=1 Tax=Alkaliphilus sp. B6464 TaxID=2731219 RepID=UPI001BA90358|nr:5'-3' exonuclease H3TH domain-containing protein [Alkaliphilus sp. B6464]QUH22194.1 hypothetical protein HYG84_20010 [Alkaliphilus sp. B6464]